MKIITDSCCDLPQEILKDFDVVPMTLVIDGQDYKDGVDITRTEYYQKLKLAKKSPGSASPSPAEFLKKFSEAERLFVVTVSSALSSSFNNALLSKRMYQNKFAEKMVDVFDSLNASVGQGLILLKLKELIDNNLPSHHIVQHVEEYIKEVKTFFILENMNNLINSGRINRIMGKLVSALNIKLIMGKTDEGKIELFDKIRGSRRAFNKLIKMIGEYGTNFEDKILAIAHFNALEKAKDFQKEVEKLYNFKNIIITQMGPTIATYADEGAILISF